MTLKYNINIKKVSTSMPSYNKIFISNKLAIGEYVI
jgi:hypothetical protein